VRSGAISSTDLRHDRGVSDDARAPLRIQETSSIEPGIAASRIQHRCVLKGNLARTVTTFGVAGRVTSITTHVPHVSRRRDGDGDKPIRRKLLNYVSRNNIFDVTQSAAQQSGGEQNDFDYDLSPSRPT